jgi:hypothetical protein
MGRRRGRARFSVWIDSEDVARIVLRFLWLGIGVANSVRSDLQPPSYRWILIVVSLLGLVATTPNEAMLGAIRALSGATVIAFLTFAGISGSEHLDNTAVLLFGAVLSGLTTAYTDHRLKGATGRAEQSLLKDTANQIAHLETVVTTLTQELAALRADLNRRRHWWHR